MTYTPDSLRVLGDDDIWPVGTHEIRRRLFAHADAWEAQLRHIASEYTAQAVIHQDRIDKLEADNAALRERVTELERQTKLLAGTLSTFGRYSTMHPEEVLAEFAALASLPDVVPSSDDVGTTHDPPEPDYQPDGSPEPNHRRSAQRAVGRFADPDEPCPPGDYD